MVNGKLYCSINIQRHNESIKKSKSNCKEDTVGIFIRSEYQFWDVHVYLSIWFALEIQTVLDGKYYVFPLYYPHV